MSAVAAVVLAGLFAAPVRGADWVDFDAEFSRQSIKALRRLNSCSEQAEFLFREKVDLSIVEPGEGISPDAIGSYNSAKKRMFMNKQVLMSGVSELLEIGFHREEVADILAWKMLPTLVHELTHGMIDSDLRRHLGFSYSNPVLEDEIIAFFEEVLVLQEMFEKRPVLWHRGMILEIEHSAALVLGAWEKRTEDLKKMVERIYPNRWSIVEAAPHFIGIKLSEERKGLEREAGEIQAEIAKLSARVASGYDGGGGWDDPRGPERELAELKEMDAFYRGQLRRNERLSKALSNERVLGKIKDFYKHHLGLRVSRLDAVRRAVEEGRGAPSRR